MSYEEEGLGTWLAGDCSACTLLDILTGVPYSVVAWRGATQISTTLYLTVHVSDPLPSRVLASLDRYFRPFQQEDNPSTIASHDNN